jgi:hypothetical protein
MIILPFLLLGSLPACQPEGEQPSRLSMTGEYLLQSLLNPEAEHEARVQVVRDLVERGEQKAAIDRMLSQIPSCDEVAIKSYVRGLAYFDDPRIESKLTELKDGPLAKSSPAFAEFLALYHLNLVRAAEKKAMDERGKRKLRVLILRD